MTTPAKSNILHSSCVAINGDGVLILGKSGAGKSSLALELMAHGADLVADDRTELFVKEDLLFARCPAPIRGQIEARGVGILNAKSIASCAVRLVVDLDTREHDRLPPERAITLLGCPLTLLHNPATVHFSFAILQYMRAGRSA